MNEFEYIRKSLTCLKGLIEGIDNANEHTARQRAGIAAIDDARKNLNEIERQLGLVEDDRNS